MRGDHRADRPPFLGDSSASGPVGDDGAFFRPPIRLAPALRPGLGEVPPSCVRPALPPALPPVTLVLGGARSGKSRHAEGLVAESGLRPVYLATAQAFDEEMRARIAAHRGRRGAEWRLVEEPVALPERVTREAAADRALLVDCLTLWLTNLLLGGHDPDAAREDLLGRLAATPGPVVLVSNEVGLGIVPAGALSRRFVDLAGRLHQEVASVADRVVFMAAGLPLVLKTSQGDARP